MPPPCRAGRLRAPHARAARAPRTRSSPARAAAPPSLGPPPPPQRAGRLRAAQPRAPVPGTVAQRAGLQLGRQADALLRGRDASRSIAGGEQRAGVRGERLRDALEVPRQARGVDGVRRGVGSLAHAPEAQLRLGEHRAGGGEHERLARLVRRREHPLEVARRRRRRARAGAPSFPRSSATSSRSTIRSSVSESILAQRPRGAARDSAGLAVVASGEGELRRRRGFQQRLAERRSELRRRAPPTCAADRRHLAGTRRRRARRRSPRRPASQLRGSTAVLRRAARAPAHGGRGSALSRRRSS